MTADPRSQVGGGGREMKEPVNEVVSTAPHKSRVSSYFKFYE